MIENEGLPTSSESDSSESPQDPIRQLKGEFNRKLEKQGDVLKEMAASQAQLTQLLQQAMSPPKPAPSRTSDSDLDALLYSDNKAYRERLKEQTKAEIMQEIQSVNHAQSQTHQVMGELTNQFPELADASNPLTKRAAEIVNSYTANGPIRPNDYRLAVKEAAEELSVKPRSKREADGEFMGPSSYAYGAPRSAAKSTARITAEVENAAAQFGLDLSDPATRKRVLERAKRDDWRTPNQPLPSKRKK